MKINGVIVDGPHEETLVLPRGENMIPIVGRAIMDFSAFDDVHSPPKPPAKLTPKGKVEDTDDPGYRESLGIYNEKRTAWIVLETLKPSEIEWDKVNPAQPSTWRLWRDDFRDAGLTEIEIGRILRFVMEVNCLDEEKLEWARSVFLRGQQTDHGNSSSRNSEAATSKSGQPAPASE